MKFRLAAIILLLMVACSDKERPKEVLTHPEMAEMMLKVYNAETLLGANRSSVTNGQLYKHYLEKIYEDSGVKDSVFKANMAWYIARPQEMDLVYDIMIDSIKLKQQIQVSSQDVTQDSIPK